MTSLTEPAAELLVADHAFTPGLPGLGGLAGLAVDPLLDEPGLPAAPRGRTPPRHGFLAARSPRLVVVSGPPSPGIDVCVERMAEDLSMALHPATGHRVVAAYAALARQGVARELRDAVADFTER